MPEGHFVAMGQVGLTGWTRAAQPVARWIARRTGRPEAEILSLIGAAFLATTLIDFLRDVDAVIAAGEPALSQRMTLRPAQRDGPWGAVIHLSAGPIPGCLAGPPIVGIALICGVPGGFPKRDTSRPPSERM